MRAPCDPDQQTPHEAEVAAIPDPSEILVEIVQRRSSKRIRNGARVLKRSHAVHQRSRPSDLFLGSRGAFLPEEGLELFTLEGTGMLQGMDDHERALTLEQVAVHLLAIFGSGLQVEEIILYLERGAEEKAQADKRIERHSAASPDQTADAQGIDREEPA